MQPVLVKDVAPSQMMQHTQHIDPYRGSSDMKVYSNLTNTVLVLK